MSRYNIGDLVVVTIASNASNIGKVGRVTSVKEVKGVPCYRIDKAPGALFMSGMLQLASGVDLIRQERQRQIAEEGFDAVHDFNEHHMDDLARAGAFYALPAHDRCRTQINKVWPFSWEWCKPTPDDRLKELVKAGALITAEIDRILNKDVFGALEAKTKMKGENHG